MAISSYSHLAEIAAELEKLAAAGQWERMSTVVAELLEMIDSGYLSEASEADRPAIKATLDCIAAINERAIPLREDIARLLRAFGADPASA